VRCAPFVVCIVAASVALGGCGGGIGEGERARAIDAAEAAFAAHGPDLDLDRGPCIAERLDGLDDWVADVAHDPRTPVDDQPANQCRRFRSGVASHFVELDPDGNLIRAQ
jgi:hypothetical protein